MSGKKDDAVLNELLEKHYKNCKKYKRRLEVEKKRKELLSTKEGRLILQFTRENKFEKELDKLIKKYSISKEFLMDYIETMEE